MKVLTSMLLLFDGSICLLSLLFKTKQTDTFHKTVCSDGILVFKKSVTSMACGVNKLKRQSQLNLLEERRNLIYEVILFINVHAS